MWGKKRDLNKKICFFVKKCKKLKKRVRLFFQVEKNIYFIVNLIF